MSNALVGVAIDCADALTLAQFWADVLGRQVAEDSTPEHMVLLADTDTGWPLVVFNIVPEPKTVKNRLHLDLISDTFDAETERLLGLGAQGSVTCRQIRPAGRPSPTSRATSST